MLESDTSYIGIPTLTGLHSDSTTAQKHHTDDP
jgi:hypothetical protein